MGAGRDPWLFASCISLVPPEPRLRKKYSWPESGPLLTSRYELFRCWPSRQIGCVAVIHSMIREPRMHVPRLLQLWAFGILRRPPFETRSGRGPCMSPPDSGCKGLCLLRVWYGRFLEGWHVDRLSRKRIHKTLTCRWIADI